MDIRRYEPLWGSWKVENLIGKGSYGNVYRCARSEFGKEFVSAVKIISIPQDEEEIESTRMEGMDDASIKTYFSGIAKDCIKEIQLMNSLKGLTNVVSIEDYLVKQHEDGIGWDILIRMEFLTSLNQHMKAKPVTSADITKIGVDIACAIEQCSRENIIHRDIKPDNIFVTSRGDFKLGDFGIARQLERTKTSMSQKGTYSYMAPEVYKGQRYDMRVDIYSLGLVLYRLLNNNRLPFLPPYPEAITYRSREDSFARRLAGEEIPPLTNADVMLSDIILKACAFDPDKRYQTPGELKAALEATLNCAEAPAVTKKENDQEEQQTDETDGTIGIFVLDKAGLESIETERRNLNVSQDADRTVAMFEANKSDADNGIDGNDDDFESDTSLAEVILKSMIGCLLIILIIVGVISCSGGGFNLFTTTSNSISSDSTSGNVIFNGNIKDGVYRAEYIDFDAQGYKDFLEITIVNGKVVTVYADAVSVVDGSLKSDSEEYRNEMEALTDTYPEKYYMDLINQYLANPDADSIDIVAGATESSTSFKILAKALEDAIHSGITETIKVIR